MIDYAKKHGIPVPVTKAKPFSMDRNLFHISYEGGALEDPWTAPEDGFYAIDTFTYKATDNIGHSQETMVLITLGEDSSQPVDDYYRTFKGKTLQESAPGVLGMCP